MKMENVTCSEDHYDNISTVSFSSNLDNLTTNSSATCNVLQNAPIFTTTALAKAAILAILAFASLIGNIATLLTITITKKLRTKSSLYTLLFQLAIADLLVSIWCLFGEAAWTWTVEWNGGQALCKTFKFSQVFSLYLSTMTMVLIGLDRLKAVRWPIIQRSWLKPIIAIWILSAVLASPQLAIFRVMQGPFREPFYQCVTYGFYTEEWQEQVYTIFSLLTMFVIPLIILICCYAFIFDTIVKKEKDLLVRAQPVSSQRKWSLRCIFNSSRRQNRSSRPKEQNPTNMMSQRRSVFKKAKKKSLRISIILVTAFVICWAPYYFMMITFIFLNPNDKIGEGLQSAIFFFGMSNSLINPIIYGAFHLWRPSNRNNSQRKTSYSTILAGQFRRTNGVGGSRRSEVNVAIAQVHLPTIEELNTSNKSECSQDQLKSSIRKDVPNQFEESSSV